MRTTVWRICPICGASAASADAREANTTIHESEAPSVGPSRIDSRDTTRPLTPEDMLRSSLARDDVTIKIAGPVEEAVPEPPIAIGGYMIVGELGRGGMGVVYKARQLMLNRIVAVKLVLTGSHSSPQERLRFLAEAEAAAHLQHPNIVHIYEVGEHNGCPFISLEYVDGGSLSQRLAGSTVSAEEAAQIMESVARAIHFAHERGVVHRDLKPGNVLLTSRGVPKITDFGLARRLDTDVEHTKTGTVMGTPTFMAPEQAEGLETGPPADIYAMGNILYALLTGRVPFRAESPKETMRLVVEAEPLPPSRLQPNIPPELETICLKCLEKKPARRYASAELLADELHRFINREPIQTRPQGFVERIKRWSRREPALAGILAAALAAFSSLLLLAISTSMYYSSLADRLGKEQQRLRLQTAHLAQHRGASLCEAGQVNEGLLWLARALELTPAGEKDLQRGLRAGLARRTNEVASSEGDPERIVLWVQIYTSMELGQDDVPRSLDESVLEQRREQLLRLGGSAYLSKRTR